MEKHKFTDSGSWANLKKDKLKENHAQTHHALLQGVFPTQGSTRVSRVSCVGRRVPDHQCRPGSPRAAAAAAESLQSCPALCGPIDRSLPGSSAHGISQARTLELVALSFSRGCSPPRDWTHIFWSASRFFTAETPGKLFILIALPNFGFCCFFFK